MVEGNAKVSSNNWDGGVQVDSIGDADEVLASVRSDKPYPHAYLKLQPAKEAYEWVLANVGATLPKRDAVDQRIVETVRTGQVTAVAEPDIREFLANPNFPDKLIDKLAAMNRQRKVGDPFDPETEQGAQVDKAQFDKIMHYVDLGKKEGAKCVTGGSRVGNKGYFIEPTLFDDVQDDMAIAKDEIFGPVLSVFKFKDVEEVIERGNNTFYGLAAAVWTRDIGKAHRIADALKAGTVWINCYDVFDTAAPFGGFKMSGIGSKAGGPDYLQQFLEPRTITENTLRHGFAPIEEND